MNINEYESKLNNLYNLLVCKVEEKKNKSNNFDLTEKKIKELEKQNSNLVKRVEQLENENIDLKSKYNTLDEKLEKTIFYTNLLSIPHLNDDKGLESLIFKDKFSMVSNTNYKKRYINNKVLTGCLNLNELRNNKRLVIDSKKNLKNDINYIMMTLYNKEMLVNNYSFNYMLKVKKISNYKVEILNKYDYETLYNILNDKKVYYNEIKVYYFRIDELYNIISY
tara:strand:+ start:3500 stop:4168 length:669 start_codon:yes stop_codon:yes gene_type:complete